MTRSDNVPEFVGHLFRRAAGQMVSTLTRILGSAHLDLAEDVVQDALLKALEQWAYRGVPDNPTAWLIQVAKNRALDRLRRDASLDAKRGDVLAAFPAEVPAHFEALYPFRDDQLAMMFLCCHPAIAPEARIALTLKTVGGFGVRELARAFLAGESTIAQRIVRAKRQIRDGNLDLGVPVGAALIERLDSVLGVLYLMFNEGYLSRQPGADASLIRQDLSAEAIRLCRMLVVNAPTDLPRVRALLALMLLHSSRFAARQSPDGDLVLLADQNQELWNRALIEEGLLYFSASAEGDSESQYHLEAAIAAAHATALDAARTDWPYLVELYDALLLRKPTPVVALNRAVAVAYAQGPAEGLAALDAGAHPSLDGYYLVPAVRAHLLELAGDTNSAAVAYRAALALECAPAERRFLEARLQRISNRSPDCPPHESIAARRKF